MLHKASSHVIRALLLLAETPERPVGARALAQAIGAPVNYLSKLLQNLAHRGLLSSQKGMGGGFSLAKDPSDITLRDIVSCIEDVDRWNECLLGLGGCPQEKPCILHDSFQQVRESFLQILSSTTLEALVGNTASERGGRD